MSLNEMWKLRDSAAGQGLEAGARLTIGDDMNWRPATVPADVHTTLVETKRLTPLFHNMNLETCQCVDRQEGSQGSGAKLDGSQKTTISR
jgi:hypothetical protein